MQKKKKILIALFLIISLIAIGGVTFFFASSQNESKANKSEVEKNILLEKRLELKKYFVFNLGAEIQPGSDFTSNGQIIDNNPFVRRLNSSLATDLTKLLGVKKDLIIFAGTNKD